MRRLAVAALACSLLGGCLPGLNLTTLKAASGKPSNVAVYFTVDTQDGKPVGGLREGQFTVFEDGTRLAPEDSKQTLVSPKVASARYALFLVDVSGTILGPKEAGEVIKSATAFADKLDGAASVGVYVFDGSAELTPLVPFGGEGSAAAAALDKLPPAKIKGPKTDLAGGVILGLKALKKALATDRHALTFGSLVVFTDGTGHDSEASSADLRAALGSSDFAKFDVFAVGVGGEAPWARLAAIGKSGVMTEPDAGNIGDAFDRASAKVIDAASRFYLLSYCTPARSGLHQVRVEARAPSGLSGDLTYRFRADGFTAGCDPTAPTGFDLAHPPAPPADDQGVKPPPAKKPTSKPHARPPAARTPPPSSGTTTPPPPPASDPFAP